MWIDSHCHLNHPRLKEIGSVSDIVGRAVDNHVDGMLTICCRVSDEFPQVLEIANQFDNVWCTLGTHPHEASTAGEKSISQSDLVELAKKNDKVVGIGESGLDYYYNNSEPTDQQESFRKHIRVCIEADLPLVVHARDADEDIARIIKEEGEGTSLTGVMHCFSSSQYLADFALNFGFYISFSGIVTFKQSEELRDIAKTVPLERLLVETDAPFLAPKPYRGKTNQPAYVSETGKVLANIHQISEKKLAKHSKENFFQLFSKANL